MREAVLGAVGEVDASEVRQIDGEAMQIDGEAFGLGILGPPRIVSCAVCRVYRLVQHDYSSSTGLWNIDSDDQPGGHRA